MVISLHVNDDAGSVLSACGSGPFHKTWSFDWTAMVGDESRVNDCGSEPQMISPSDWADMVDSFQKCALESRLGIPLIYGIDALHGNNSVYGATIFPHNIGLGATRLILISSFLLLFTSFVYD